MQNNSFDNLMLIGRGGSGKSELLDFLKQIEEDERLKKFHIGKFTERDDFPWLYRVFQEEDLWERLGYPRRFSKKIDFIYETVDYNIYNFLTLKFNNEIKKKYTGNDFYKNNTLFMEFARGREEGYKRTFELLDAELLKNAAIIYLDNTFEESMRRNTVRSSSKDSNQTILKHKVPVSVMEYYYQTHDWYELTNKKPDGYIEAQGQKIPFVTIWNMPEIHDFKVLEERYSPALKKLWELYSSRGK